MRTRYFKLTSFLLAIIIALGVIAVLCTQVVFASAQNCDAAIEITAQNLQDATTLSSPYHVGVNLEMSMISDEMWIDNGRWMEQAFSNSGIQIMRWGYDAWVFDWENERPLLNNYQGGNNAKDDAGSYGLREFLYFCKQYDVIPFVDIPIESYDHRASSATTAGPESLANVKRLAKNMATYLDACGFEEVYFDMGNEPYSSVSCQYGGISAAAYGSLFPSFYEIIKGVNPNYKLILVHQEGATAWNNSAEAAANGYYDGVDDHQYPRPNGWANYYARNDDNIFSNGFGGNTPEDKIKIMGECNLPWPNFPAYGTNLGASIALLNGLLDLANDDYYSSVITWPSHWPTSATTANVGGANNPVGWFDLNAWYDDKATIRFNGPAYAQMIAQKNVLDKKVTSSSSNQKIRTFAYTNNDSSMLKVIVLNKQDADRVNLSFLLPGTYNCVNAMALHGERDASTRSASEWATPVYEKHLNGNISITGMQFHDTITYGECAIIYTFFNETTAPLGTFDLISPAAGETTGTAHNFTWASCDNATNYRLCVSTNSDLSEPVLDIYTGNCTNYQPSADLAPGTTYFCKVTAIGGNSSIENTSGVMQFSTVPARIFVNDTTTQDAGNGYWSYSNGWYAQAYLGCFQGDDHASCTSNAVATLSFTGRRARIYGVKGHWCGMIDVSVDNGEAQTIDLYRAAPTAQTGALPTQDLIYDTGPLSQGQHTVSIRVLAESNDAVIGPSYVELDYAEIVQQESVDYHVSAPAISADLPTNISVAAGENLHLSLTATVTNSEQVLYEWYKDNELIAVTTLGEYSSDDAGNDDAGTYYVRITNFAQGVSKTVVSGMCEVTVNGTQSALQRFLSEAAQTGFCYMFSGTDRLFDGTKVVAGNAQDIERLRTSTAGTLLVRYKSTVESNQVIFAAGKDNGQNQYGALLANNVPNIRQQRIDFPGGMVANLGGDTITDQWHTFAYSVDASDLSNKQAKTVTSFDGSTNTQYPNYASWFNYNQQIQDMQYLMIGGINDENRQLAQSGTVENFVGEIAFVAFIPQAVTQQQASVLTAEGQNEILYQASNVTISTESDAIAFDAQTMEALKALDEITVIVQYENTNAGIGSLFSISDPTTTNSHFHLYQYGNTVGFEFRNADSPKYAATCANAVDSELNTVAFKAETDVGYKLFANGIHGATLAKEAAAYQFIRDLANQTTGYVGKTKRPNDINQYPFTGVIHSIEIYAQPLSDAYLIARTSETAVNEQRVFYNGDETGSKFFRIPFLLATENNTLIAGTDVNFGSTGDSAENIDCAIRVKTSASTKSAYEGWSDAQIPSALHMQDYTDAVGYQQQSASFIDGVIVEDGELSNRILLVIDAWPWNGGLFSYLNVNAEGQASGGTMRTLPYGDGFCTINGQKYLLLSSENITGSDGHGTNNINANTVRANFDYVADIYGEKNAAGRYNVYHLQGTPNEYVSSAAAAVGDSNLSIGALSEYSLSVDYEIYKNGEMLTVYQRADDSTYTATQVPMKVFYKDSELQLYNTSYLMQIYSDDGGASWHTDKLISGMVKPENSTYFITGPGCGIQIKAGVHTGRLALPVYFGMNGVSSTAIIYSDDGGVTWNLGAKVPVTYGISEAALVEMPDGSIKVFARNTASSAGKYIMATSTDGGETWIDVQSVFGDNNAGVNSQMSALRLSTTVADPDDPTQTYPALLMCSAGNSNRTNGHIWLGLIKENGNYDNGATKYTIDWAYDYELTGSSELFAYSSMAQISDERIGVLYEASPDNTWLTGLQGINYDEISLSELTQAQN